MNEAISREQELKRSIRQCSDVLCKMVEMSDLKYRKAQERCEYLQSVVDELKAASEDPEVALSKKTDEALIEHLRIENGCIDMAVSIPDLVSQHFSRLALMGLKGCENYIAGEIKFQGKDYEFCLKKADGLHPAQKASKLEAENASLHEQIKKLNSSPVSADAFSMLQQRYEEACNKVVELQSKQVLQ